MRTCLVAVQEGWRSGAALKVIGTEEAQGRREGAVKDNA